MTTSLPVRVRLRFPDLDTFVERFAANVTRGGVFIASRSPRPVGDVFAFEVQIASGEVALAGEGKVIWVKEFDEGAPQKPHGMGVQFVSLTPASRPVLKRMLALKDAKGAPGAPRGLTAPLATLQGRSNGVPQQPRVDTNVDLAAEFGLEESVLRRALDRAWGPGARPAEDELQGLLSPEPAPAAVTLQQVLKELPRMLDRSRSRSGAFRTLESIAAVAKEPETPVVSTPPATKASTNGVSGHHAHSEEHQG